ncbi:DUF1801 domain-containing protein [Halocola ammonii]
MIRELDQFYLNLEEPQRSCFEALRDIILSVDPDITPEWKYRLPFFYYRGKMFCYLWKDKKSGEPYIGIVNGNQLNHPLLEQGDRKRMKILRVDPEADIPKDVIIEILNNSIRLH